MYFLYTCVLQFCGMNFGVGSDGNPLSEKPEELDQAIDWCKPGGPRSRESCVKLLVEHGANIHEVDYQGFTVLHFAAMWGMSHYSPYYLYFQYHILSFLFILHICIYIIIIIASHSIYQHTMLCIS